MKRIVIDCNSVAECLVMARKAICYSDLGHKARLSIEIEIDSPFDKTWIDALMEKAQ